MEGLSIQAGKISLAESNEMLLSIQQGRVAPKELEEQGTLNLSGGKLGFSDAGNPDAGGNGPLPPVSSRSINTGWLALGLSTALGAGFRLFLRHL